LHPIAKMNGMVGATVIMGVLAAATTWVAYQQGKHIDGLNAAWKMTWEILPLLAFALILSGMVQVIIPQELITQWVGSESGAKGIWMGTLAGGLCPGGPYVSFPIVVALLRSGASVPTVVAFLTSWSLWAVSRLALEVGFLGWRFVVIRLACVFFFPPLAGYMAMFVMKVIK